MLIIPLVPACRQRRTEEPTSAAQSEEIDEEIEATKKRLEELEDHKRQVSSTDNK
jgi:hypothetical protein